MNLPEELQGIEDAVREHMDEIPFWHSQYQIEKLILNKESPERSYRQALLEMRNRYNALRKAHFRRERLSVKLEQLQNRAAKETDPLKRRLIDIDIEEKLFDLADEDKFIKDAIVELAIYYNAYKQFPKFNRTQFELSEPEHWRKRAVQQAERDVLSAGSVSHGNIELLTQVGLNPYQVQEELRLIASQQRQAFLLEKQNPAKIGLSSPDENGADRSNPSDTDDVAIPDGQEGPPQSLAGEDRSGAGEQSEA